MTKKEESPLASRVKLNISLPQSSEFNANFRSLSCRAVRLPAHSLTDEHFAASHLLLLPSLLPSFLPSFLPSLGTSNAQLGAHQSAASKAELADDRAAGSRASLARARVEQCSAQGVSASDFASPLDYLKLWTRQGDKGNFWAEIEAFSLYNYGNIFQLQLARMYLLKQEVISPCF